MPSVLQDEWVTMKTDGLLKKTLIMLVAMIGLALGIGFALPGTFHVERTLVIDAAPDKVFPWVNDLTKWPKWDPWTRADPDIKHQYSGTQGVGHTQNWKGPRSGVGQLKVVTSTHPKEIRVELRTDKITATRLLTFTLKDLGKKTKLTWSIDGENNMKPIGNWFGLGMNKYLGPMYEQGLSNIKALTETGKLPPEVKPLRAPKE
jgi:hypothetical protein